MARISLKKLLSLTAVAFMATASHAQPVQRELLKELQTTNAGMCQRITTTLEFPVAVEGYAPLRQGQILVVRIQPLHAPGEPDAELLKGREALIPENRTDTVLSEVTWEGDDPAGPQLVFRFTRNVNYSVTSGNDSRSVIVTVLPETTPPAACRD